MEITYKNALHMRNKAINTEIGEVRIKNFLGRGKSGYSFIAEKGTEYVVIKIMHDEHMNYLDSGDRNKVVCDVISYTTLSKIEIRMPKI